jgi:hypothetical protein
MSENTEWNRAREQGRILYALAAIMRATGLRAGQAIENARGFRKPPIDDLFTVSDEDLADAIEAFVDFIEAP